MSEPITRRSHRFLAPWVILAVAGSAQFLVLLESTIVNVAIPSTGGALGDGGWLVWVLSGYLLAFGGLLLPGGVWADRRGHRTVFFTALGGLAVASALCALAPSIELLVGARVLQGGAAGVLAASALGIVLSRYQQTRERAIALTVWSALGVVGAVVGSLVAGPLIGGFGWPGVFWVNVAAVLLLAPFAWRTIQSGTRPANSPTVWPAFVVAAGAAAALAGLSIAEHTLAIGVPVALAGVGAIAVTVLAQRRTVAPILPVRLFRLASYRSAAVGLFLTNGVMIAAMFAYSRHLQDHYALTAQAASLAVTPMAIASLLTAFTTDLIIGRVGETRTFRIGAGALLAGTGAVFAVSLTDAVWGWLVAGGILIGTGLPITFVVLNRRVFAEVEDGESGTASGFTNMLTTLGGATTVALVASAGALAGQPAAYAVLLVIAGMIAVLARKRTEATSGP